MLAVVSVWHGFAQFEAQTEQGKALAAGTTMAGSAELSGGVPLVIAHMIGLGVLIVLGWRGYRAPGIACAVVAILIASGVGIAIAQLVWGGERFQLGIHNDTFVP